MILTSLSFIKKKVSKKVRVVRGFYIQMTDNVLLKIIYILNITFYKDFNIPFIYFVIHESEKRKVIINLVVKITGLLKTLDNQALHLCRGT